MVWWISLVNRRILIPFEFHEEKILKARYLFPLIIFLLIAGLLWRGLQSHPDKIPSALIGKATPSFELPNLLGLEETISQKIFLNQVSIVNVWASWCYACTLEHSVLMSIAHDVTIYGLNYKDDPKKALAWLKTYGNPYKAIFTDQKGNIAIDWGVYGTPETFIIDKKGIIRRKHIGPMTQDIWENELRPFIEKIRNEP